MNSEGPESPKLPQNEPAPPPVGPSASPPIADIDSRASAHLPIALAPDPSPTAGVPGPFVTDSDERCLWIDPLAEDERTKCGAVLLDDVIHDYVFKYNLLFERSSFEEGKLKGGSYTMTPAAKDAWTFVPSDRPNEPDVKVALRVDRDAQGEFYVVPRNSLVFVKLEQTLRLPFYIIGRHNLKIRYVYKGLLLGTGPQVDPGFEGNLFIPLHNFTTSEVRVYLRQSFVSIDFVRTTRFVEKSSISGRRVTELRAQLEETRKLIEVSKLQKRRTLEDYLEGARPRSQMAQFQFDFDALTKRVDEALHTAKTWALWERIALFITIAGLFVGELNLFRGYVADLKSDTKEVKAIAASANLDSLETRISILRSNSTLMSNSIGSNIPGLILLSSNLSSNINDLDMRLHRLELLLMRDQQKSTNAK